MEWILASHFLASSPAWIPEGVDIYLLAACAVQKRSITFNLLGVQ